MNKASPASLRDCLNGILISKTQWIERLQNNRFIYAVITLFLIGLNLGFYHVVTFNPDFTGAHNSFFETRYFWLLPTITIYVLFIELLTHHLQNKTEVILIFCYCGIFILVPEILTYAQASYLPSAIRIAILFTLGLHLLIFKFSRDLKYSTRLILFFFTELALVFYLDVLTLNDFFDWSFWITHPYRYIFTFSMLAADEEIKKSRLPFNWQTSSYVLSPMNWITPLPIRYSDWNVSVQKSHYQAKSTLYLIISLILLVACAYIQHYRSLLSLMELRNRSFAAGFATYLFYFCFSYANINIPIALAWRFGYPLPEPYQFPLLSTSPQDRWRRWNTYFYEWYFRSIFFPVFKKTKSYFSAVMLSFIATLFIHLGSQNAEYIMVGLVSDSFSRQFYKKMLFFLGHGLAVYFGIRLEKWLPNENKISGWIGVVGMMLLMSLIHGVFIL